MKKINVLGTEYTIEDRDIADDDKLYNREAYTDSYLKLIVMGKIEQRESFKNAPDSKIKSVKDSILRHEIFHAFMYESGLDSQTNVIEGWATNEEMIDWFAIQSPKIFKVYQELDILC